MATLSDLIQRLGSERSLEPVAHYLTAARRVALSNHGVRETLEGRNTTGTPLHPALVHFPIGGAFAAATLDLLGHASGAAVLTATTAGTAGVAAATGLADFGEIADPRKKRIAAAHYLAAISGAALSVTSLVARGTDHPGLARFTLLGACAGFATAGALGGHVVYGDAPSRTV